MARTIVEIAPFEREALRLVYRRRRDLEPVVETVIVDVGRVGRIEGEHLVEIGLDRALEPGRGRPDGRAAGDEKRRREDRGYLPCFAREPPNRIQARAATRAFETCR